MNLNIFFSRIIPHICGIITISYTPFTSIDPTSPVKMAILGTCAFAFLFILFFTYPIELKSNNRALLIILIFVFDLLLVFFLSPENKVEQFYGAISRNFGLLTQISLAIFFLVSALFSSPNLISKFKRSILIYGSINIIYGYLQIIGEDFVKNWDTTYANSARGFFANPNQNSSFTALVALVSLSNLLNQKRKITEHFGSISFSIIALINIYFARSIQGYLILIVGIMLLFLLFLRQNKIYSKYLIPAVLAEISLGFLAILDLFQKVPWKSFLYGSTVEARGDYWRAGIEMGRENPFFGVGLDKYLEWYRIYRDDIAAARPYASEVSNSAHNIFIDYFAFGGFPLLFIYILIQLLVIFKLIKIIKLNPGYNSELVTLILIFSAFSLQGLVSPAHIGFNIWGWVTMGLVMGWKFNQSDQSQIKIKPSNNVLKVDNDMPSKLRVIMVLIPGLLLGSLTASSYLVQEARFRNGVYGVKTYQEMFDAAYIKPKSSYRMAQASWKLYINGSKDKSLKLALDAVLYSPNNYYAWLVLFSMSDLDPGLTEEVKRNIERLEPRPGNIKKIM